MLSALRIEDLSVQLRLGVSTEERANPQEVRLRAELRFRERPLGGVTDSIRDTVCYAQLCEVLRGVCEAKEFCLIEHLAEECLNAIARVVEGRAQIGISVCKARPPVVGLLGAHYSCGDFLL